MSDSDNRASSCALRVRLSLPENIDQNPDPNQTDEKIGSAVTDKGQRQAFIRQESRGNTDVDDSLEAQEAS